MAISECALYHDILKDDYHHTRISRYSVEHYFSSRCKAAINDPLHLRTILYPPPQVANYIRKALPPVPATCQTTRRKPSIRRNASGIHVKMTFGVLSTGPKRFTLTDEKGTFVGPGITEPTRETTELTAEETPIQSPQPQQPSSKINQITGYALNEKVGKNLPHHRRVPSNKIKQLTGYDLCTPSRDAPLNSSDSLAASIHDSNSDASRRTSSIYSQNQEDEGSDHSYTKRPESFAHDVPSLWQSWRPISLESAKRVSENSNISDDSEPYSDQSFVPTGLHVAPLTLRTRDRPQTSQGGGLFNGQAELYAGRNLQRESRSQGVSDETTPTGPSLSPYNATIDAFHCPDPAQFALDPRLALEPSKPIRPRADSSRFSDSDESDSEGGYSIAKGKDVVVHGLRSIPSHINFTTPTFRKANKPASIRTISSTTSSHQKTPASALKSPYPFVNRRSNEDHSSDSSPAGRSDTSPSDPNGSHPFRRRFSSAFRSFSSKTSTNTSNTSAPSMNSTSPSTKTSISSSSSTLPKERVVYTTTRKPGTPDTPARPSFRKTYSFGPVGTHKVRDMIKGKLSGQEEKRDEEEKVEERRRRILNSIRVVRFGEEEKAVEVFDHGEGIVKESVEIADAKATAWL